MNRLGVAAALVDGAVVPGDVEITDGRIVATGRRPAGRGGLAVPGLVDLHIHGCAGVDFLADGAAGHTTAAPALLASGVTAYQPTFVCSPPAVVATALDELAAARVPDGPRLLGAHLEGPFLSPAHLGAHDPRHRRDPDPALALRLLDAGPVSEVTIAPELPGGLDLVRLLADRGVTVSVGHTGADAAHARAAFAAGARAVTHLCNAMRPLHHRSPGVVGVALTAEGVTFELIVDGHHLDDDMVRLIWRAAAERVALVSDGTAATGMADGTYSLGEGTVTITESVVRGGDGGLAGGAATLVEAVRNLHALGVPLPAAVDAASRVPANLIGRRDLGRLRPGAAADLLVLDDALTVRATFVAGHTRYAV
ncbi:MAG TPA: N-acetylglucosamine-6-phosphate deacetylase [Euzebyales bacterium]|nr:N-acetylglucosamine-6-phosphate deacetylase [Euzebyales bacterium]